MTCKSYRSAYLVHQLVFQESSSHPPVQPLSSFNPWNDFPDDSLLLHPNGRIVKVNKLDCNLDLEKVDLKKVDLKKVDLKKVDLQQVYRKRLKTKRPKTRNAEIGTIFISQNFSFRTFLGIF